MKKPLPFFLLVLIALVFAILHKTGHHSMRRAEKDVAHALADAGARLLQQAPGGQVVPGQDTHVPTDLVTRSHDVGHRDFEHAKEVLNRAVYTGALREEFYCGCDYDNKRVNLGSCGVVPRKNASRASRFEWEHIVTAWEIGHQRQCWQQGGRENCSHNDPVYRVAEGDLVNLVPAVGEVNGDRSNFPYSQWTSHPQPLYGKCETVVDFDLKRAQPRPEVRGRIARVFFYMHQHYGLGYSRQDQQLMCAWAAGFPIDDWERERDRRIVALQGTGNPLVEQPAAIKPFCG